MASTKPRNHEFSDYLSLDMYILTTAGYHEITYPRIYFVLTQTTTIVLLQQLLYIIEFGIVLDITARWTLSNNQLFSQSYMKL